MLNRLQPRTLAQQMSLLMTVSLSLLFIAFFVTDAIQQKTLEETATGTEQLSRIKSLLPLVKVLNAPQLREFERSFSRCFYGYRISQQPLDFSGERQEMLEVRIGNYLDLERSKVRVHTATFSQADFSYEQCDGSMSFPLDGMVISIRLGEKKWLNSEVHRHVWHLRESHSWLFWAITAFTVIAALSIILISHLTRPLSALSHASRQFAKGLVVSEVKKQGPPDLQDTIESFNTMQKDVIGAIENRTVTLAAISHDIRTPLTALKLKVTLLDDESLRESLMRNIDKIEMITASGLEFLKGQHKEEPFRKVNLTALLETECHNFSELRMDIKFTGPDKVSIRCRPIAMTRAIQNLLENANKYAYSATMSLIVGHASITIEVRDIGPGIPDEELTNILEPFKRLSKARESDKGGFGLGLAIVKEIVEGHGGAFSLENVAHPQGLKTCITLPLNDH